MPGVSRGEKKRNFKMDLNTIGAKVRSGSVRDRPAGEFNEGRFKAGDSARYITRAGGIKYYVTRLHSVPYERRATFG